MNSESSKSPRLSPRTSALVGGGDRVHVEQDSAWDERLLDPTQGVHDALRLDSSQRPAEERDVEGRRPGQILSFADLELHPVGQLGRAVRPRQRDQLLVRVEAEDALGPW